MYDRFLDYIYAAPVDMTIMTSILRGTGDNTPTFRSSGTRARRQWKRRRAAGITKRVRS